MILLFRNNRKYGGFPESRIMKYNPDIIKSNRKTVSLEIRPDGKLTVRAPLRMSYSDIEKYVNSKSAWIEKALEKFANKDETPAVPFTEEELKKYTKAAEKIIPERVKHYAEIMGVEYNRITIRTPKTRWGSCSSKKNLNFSCLLVLMPEKVMDSVVVHELCHLKEMNHSKRFYAEIYKVMPDYDEYDRWQKTNGGNYLRRL